MSNTTPDFQADEFLLDRYVGQLPLVRFAASGKSHSSNSIRQARRQ